MTLSENMYDGAFITLGFDLSVGHTAEVVHQRSNVTICCELYAFGTDTKLCRLEGTDEARPCPKKQQEIQCGD